MLLPRGHSFGCDAAPDGQGGDFRSPVRPIVDMDPSVGDRRAGSGRWCVRIASVLAHRLAIKVNRKRGIGVDHVTVYRWAYRFTSLFADAARFARHSPE